MNTAALRLEPSVPSKERPQEPELKPYTMEEIYADIEESRADIAAGRVYTTEQVDKMMREKYKWLR